MSTPHPPQPPVLRVTPMEHRRFAREAPGGATPTKKITVLIRISMPPAAKPLLRASRFIA